MYIEARKKYIVEIKEQNQQDLLEMEFEEAVKGMKQGKAIGVYELLRFSEGGGGNQQASSGG